MIQALEPRRMLSFAAFGTDTNVTAGAGTASSADVAAADDGTFIIASVITAGAKTYAQVVRYSPSGEQVGDPLAISPAKNSGVNAVSVAVDAVGNAVVAYQASSEDWFGTYRIYANRISRFNVVSEAVQVGSAAELNEDIG